MAAPPKLSALCFTVVDAAALCALAGLIGYALRALVAG